MRKKNVRKEGFAALHNTHPGWVKQPDHLELLFPAQQPYVLELGCGKGYFTVQHAALHPEWNHFGVDIKADRLYMGAQEALDQSLANVRFVQTDVELFVHNFPAGSCARIWVTFPDPYPAESYAKRRLTHRRFLETYRNLLLPGGQLHFKTDNPSLFQWSENEFGLLPGVRFLHRSEDVHATPGLPFEVYLLTAYEQRWHREGRKTLYLAVDFPNGTC